MIRANHKTKYLLSCKEKSQSLTFGTFSHKTNRLIYSLTIFTVCQSLCKGFGKKARAFFSKTLFCIHTTYTHTFNVERVAVWIEVQVNPDHCFLFFHCARLHTLASTSGKTTNAILCGPTSSVASPSASALLDDGTVFGNNGGSAEPPPTTNGEPFKWIQQ